MDNWSDEATRKLPTQNQDALNPFLTAVVHRIVVYNVGQGNGVIVSTDKAFWIVDFGSMGSPTVYSKNKSYHTFDNRLKAARDLLESNKDLPIIVMVSHPDADHINGLYDLLHDLKDPQNQSRIKFWIYSVAYSASNICKNADNANALTITASRFVVDRAYVRRPKLPGQTIFFVNSPEINADETNANSMMLKVIVGGKNRVLLAGDATLMTVADLRYSHFLNSPNKLEQDDWKESLEWKQFTEVDYLVAPHHGADTEDSHLIARLVNPSKGVIFSTPMFSHHGHPTFQAVLNALQSVDSKSSINNGSENLLYWFNKQGLSDRNIKAKLLGTETTLKFCFTYHDEVRNIVSSVKAGIKPIGLPGAGLLCFATSKRQVYITGVHGDVQCDQNICEPLPFFLADAEKTLAFSSSEADLKQFLQISFEPVDKQRFIFTKFAKEDLKAIYDVKKKEAMDKWPNGSEALENAGPSVDQVDEKRNGLDNWENTVKWDYEFGILPVFGSRGPKEAMKNEFNENKKNAVII